MSVKEEKKNHMTFLGVVAGKQIFSFLNKSSVRLCFLNSTRKLGQATKTDACIANEVT